MGSDPTQGVTPRPRCLNARPLPPLCSMIARVVLQVSIPRATLTHFTIQSSSKRAACPAKDSCRFTTRAPLSVSDFFIAGPSLPTVSGEMLNPTFASPASNPLHPGKHGQARDIQDHPVRFSCADAVQPPQHCAGDSHLEQTKPLQDGPLVTAEKGHAWRTMRSKHF